MHNAVPPDAVAPPQLQGYVDARSPHHLQGWARDLNNPDTRLAVEAVRRADGAVLAHAVADRFIAALRDIGVGDGRHAWFLPLPGPLSPADLDGIDVHAAAGDEAGTRHILEIPPTLVENHDPYQGYIDATSPTRIVGWARNTADPEDRVAVLAVRRADGAELARGVADRFSDNLVQIGVGDGRHAFELRLPRSMTIDERAGIDIVTVSGAHVLERSPHISNESATYQGYVDAIGTWRILGWARNTADPDDRVDVEAVLRADGAVLARATADRFSETLVKVGVGDGHYAFELNMPRAMSAAECAGIDVRVAGGEHALERAPGLVEEHTLFPDDVAGGDSWHLLGWARNAEAAHLRAAGRQPPPPRLPYDEGTRPMEFNGGYRLMASHVTKFFNSVRVQGWFHHPEHRLASVEVLHDDMLACVTAVEQPSPGLDATLGANRGFHVQFLRPEDRPIEQTALRFTATSGWTVEVPLMDMCRERIKQMPSQPMLGKFITAMRAIPGARVLDIGGRSRSDIDFSAVFGGLDWTVLDIIPGPNVDVVCDAHVMADTLPAESFDGVLSVSVFEHLMMPWTVATQMNRVMKTGGLAFIVTHQAVGLHDLPWDFWRFSDAAWDALFNVHTGFEIVERHIDYELLLLPYIYRREKNGAEADAGFEASSVIVRKTGPCRMHWDLRPADITASMYPQDD